jgi:chaperonin GroES
MSGDEKLPISMLNDRLLLKIPVNDVDRRSGGGILIPATAQVAKRLVWAEVVALGQTVRAAEVGDRVLFSPDDRYEVEVGGIDYIMLRERDLHAVAASRIEASTGLYL